MAISFLEFKKRESTASSFADFKKKSPVSSMVGAYSFKQPTKEIFPGFPKEPAERFAQTTPAVVEPRGIPFRAAFTKETREVPTELAAFLIPIKMASRLAEIVPKAIVQTIQNYREIRALGRAEPLELPFDAKRLGFTGEVESTGVKLNEAFDYYNEKYPPSKDSNPEYRLTANAMRASFTTVVPDVLDAIMAGEQLKFVSTVALQATGYDPVLDRALTEMGLPKNKFSIGQFKERFVDTLLAKSQQGDIQGAMDTMSSVYRISGKFKGEGIPALNKFGEWTQNFAKNLAVKDIFGRGFVPHVIAPGTGLPGFGAKPGGAFGLSIKELQMIGGKQVTGTQVRAVISQQAKGLTEMAIASASKLPLSVVSEVIKQFKPTLKPTPVAPEAPVKPIKPEIGVIPPSAKKVLDIKPAPFIEIKKRETTLLKERIRAIQKQAKAENWGKVKLTQEIEKARIRQDIAVRKEQLKTLKTGITERIKGIQKGIREGTIATKQEIKAVQTGLLNILDESRLNPIDKAKFNRTIKNIQTLPQLEKSVIKIKERIIVLEENSIKRSLVKAIDKELKYTKPIKRGQVRVGKYDYESNKAFDKVRGYNKLNQEDALARLNEMPIENMSEGDKVAARLLSYKVNGMNSSITLQEQVLADIREMKRIGKETKTEADFDKQMKRQKDVEVIREAIAVQKKSRILIKGVKSTYISSVANLYSAVNSMAGKGIADKYDYGLYQTNSMNDANARIEIAVNQAKKIYGVKSNRQLSSIFIKELAPNNFTITDTEGYSVKISRFDLMNIYNGLKNDLIKSRYYNNFGKTQIDSLLQNLDPRDAQMADYMMEDIQRYKEMFNKRSIEMFGRDMGTVENYWPTQSEHRSELFDGIRIQGETPSSVKQRVQSSKVVPKMTNAWTVYQRHIYQAEHVKSLSKRYEELKRVFSDRQIERTIRDKYGDKAYESLMDNIETFSLNKKIDRLDIFSNMYNKALNNWVKAKVASPTVFARQLISSNYSVTKVGIKNFVKYQTEMVVHPKKSFRFMWDNVPFIRDRFKRGYSEALQDVIKGTKDLKIGMDSITKYTTLATRGGDVTAIVLNGYPIIKTELAKGKSMEEAIEEFQKFTAKTQQSPAPADLSSPQRGKDAFHRTFFRFKNTVNQLLRLQVDANIQAFNKQIPITDWVKQTLMYSVYTPMMYVLIGFAINEGYKWIFDNEDEEKSESLLGDVAQQIVLQPFQVMPLLDAATEAAYSEIRKRTTGKDYYYGDSLFSYPLLDDIATAWSKASKKEPSAEDFLRVISLIQEPITGIPTETILRYIRYSKPKESSSKKSSTITIPTRK